MEIRIGNIEALPEAAARFVEAFGSGAAVFAFNAPMGAGKTTFISEVCRQLGCLDEVSSPTFSIINEYDTAKWGKVYHFDCYRLDSEEEAFDIGAEDYFDSGRPCFVEWPERIAGLLPADAVPVDIRVDDDGARIVSWPS